MENNFSVTNSSNIYFQITIESEETLAVTQYCSTGGKDKKQKLTYQKMVERELNCNFMTSIFCLIDDFGPNI